MKNYLLLGALLISSSQSLFSQNQKRKIEDGLKFSIFSDSVSYIKAAFLGQFWLRYNSNNPGSTVNGTPQKDAYDIGIRRIRFSMTSQITNRFFVFTQIGLNNVNTLSKRKEGMFFHDATAEVKFYKNYLDIGVGLSGWNGTSRYSSSSTSSIMGLDLPVIQETTNDVTDQFGRKFGVFLKGKLHKFDYRFSIAKPFPVQNSLATIDELPTNELNKAYFSQNPPKLNTAGYIYYSFFDTESNLLPYMTGSYLGNKKILNIGTGFQYQKDAMWYHSTGLDTTSAPLQQFGFDIFFDSYLNKDKKNAITAYVAYLNYYFGPNYIRNAGPMNVANGIQGVGSFNGAGNKVPLVGTGNVFYGQFAFKFKDQLLKDWGTLQPYIATSYASYDRLNNPVQILNIGMNWLMLNHNAKLSIDYQSRPVFFEDAIGQIIESKSARRGQIVLQYQIAI